jgi:hypothetical protein
MDHMPPATPRWTLVRDRLNTLYRCRSEIGTPPPQPPTWRGRTGRHLVTAMRRALFWLLPQLDRFHASSIDLAEEEVRALEELAAAQERLDGALGRTLAEFVRRHGELQREVAELRAELRAVRSAGES